MTTQTEAMMYSRLQNSIAQTLIYERRDLQEKARACIPLTMLKEKSMKEEIICKNRSMQDILIEELLHWFKRDFFSWVDTLPCRYCQSPTVNRGVLPPEGTEKTWGADRVENHECTVCKRSTRFPRYNHPGQLLETRQGRCGEWANCFTLCCRAIGFEARYILDLTDHVWTEVYSESQKRWLHCDPCEDTCDKPLLYEAGWGKKLTYVFAFSKDDIQDVTWRYSAKHSEVLKRRNLCRESWLLASILRCRAELQTGLSDNRKNQLQDRQLVEIVELLLPKECVSAEETAARSTGSLNWRVSRGEMGKYDLNSAVIKPSERDLMDMCLNIKYCSSKDMYIRNTDVKVSGWATLVFNMQNIMRKEESDWKMAYLARIPGSDKGVISWKFDLSGTAYAIDRIEIQAKSACFENGSVLWQVCSGDICTTVLPGGLMTSVFSGKSELTLTAELEGGRGENAWQHTQLFRQALNDHSSPLNINIYLIPQSR